MKIQYLPMMMLCLVIIGCQSESVDTSNQIEDNVIDDTIEELPIVEVLEENSEGAVAPEITEPVEEPDPIVEDIEDPSQPAECSSGYTYTQSSFPSPMGANYYCKINKEFDDFISCLSDSECESEESCVARMDTEDYRCVPLANYQMSCYCQPNQGCVCV